LPTLTKHQVILTVDVDVSVGEIVAVLVANVALNHLSILRRHVQKRQVMQQSSNAPRISLQLYIVIISQHLTTLLLLSTHAHFEYPHPALTQFLKPEPKPKFSTKTGTNHQLQCLWPFLNLFSLSGCLAKHDVSVLLTSA